MKKHKMRFPESIARDKLIAKLNKSRCMFEDSTDLLCINRSLNLFRTRLEKRLDAAYLTAYALIESAQC